MSVLKCTICGGDLDINSDITVGVCQYCGSTLIIPKQLDKKGNLYNRANALRQNNEFDKAIAAYEDILKEDYNDIDALWGLALCKFGIEYVEDPNTGERVPTCHRLQFESILLDTDYQAAVGNSDEATKIVLQSEARRIDLIQKRVLEIASKEDPFDVFICYKESDDFGNRTEDSVIAQEMYYELTKRGYKVFFARKTLENMLGNLYEPVIFAALNSARAMVALGTKPDNFNAVWVKNEWSRYRELIKKGLEKTLIPAYRGFSAYELPIEFASLQALDMSKLGFMHDLIDGLDKILKRDNSHRTDLKPVELSQNNSKSAVLPLLDRAFICLEDGEFGKADELLEQVLNTEPRLANAYVGKLMAELHVKNQDDLKQCAMPFDDRNNYNKAIRFADEQLSSKLKGYILHINERNETNHKDDIYRSGISAMKNATDEDTYTQAAYIFQQIPGFRDSDVMLEQCQKEVGIIRLELEQKAETDRFERERRAEEEQLKLERRAEIERTEHLKRKRRKRRIVAIIIFLIIVVSTFSVIRNTVFIPANKYNEAQSMLTNKQYNDAIAAFSELGNYKDSAEKVYESKYLIAQNMLSNKQYFNAVAALSELGDYKDSKALIISTNKKLLDLYNTLKLSNIDNKSMIAAGEAHTVGLKSDGTVVAVGDNLYNECNVGDWRDITAVAAGYGHTVGLKSDGTVVAVGMNNFNQLDVSSWTNIISVAAGSMHTVGLKSDGMVVAVGHNSYEQLDVSGWTNIIAVAAGSMHTVGLKSDGTVVAVGPNGKGQLNVSTWTDIVAVAAGDGHTVGLKSDGTVVAVGLNQFSQLDVSTWTDIVAVAASEYYTVGLKSDGTVVAVGDNFDNQLDVGDWKYIIYVAAGSDKTLGLRCDGTVVAVGDISDKQFDVSAWTNIGITKIIE